MTVDTVRWKPSS